MLRRAEDARAVAWLVLQHVVLAAAWYRWHDTAAWLRAGAWAVLAYFAFAAACITHNSVHVPVFRSARLEALWLVVLTLGYGHPASTFHSGHNLSHHRFTQSRRDPMRTSKARFRWHWLNLLLFQPTVAPRVLAMDAAFLYAVRRARPALVRQCAAEALSLLAATVCLVALDPARWVVLVLLPHLFAQWGIVTMNLLQHDGCALAVGEPWPAGQPPPRAYNMARNFTGALLNALTFNNGYHTAHHFFPTTHWADLPLRHEAEIRPYAHPALEQPSLVRYVVATFVWPGRRCRYDGTALPVGVDARADASDDDWTAEYAAKK